MSTMQPRPDQRCGRLGATGVQCRNPTQKRAGYYACWAHVTEDELVACASEADLRAWLLQAMETGKALEEKLDNERARRRQAEADGAAVDDMKAQLVRVAAAGQLDCQLRRTSQVEEFPYFARRVSWLAIWPDRTITSPAYTEERNNAMAARAEGLLLALLISWPGEWSTDTFVVDDEAWPVVQAATRAGCVST